MQAATGHKGCPPLSIGPQAAGEEETKMEQVLPAVRTVVEEAVAYANRPDSPEPPVPAQLATREDAIAAIRAGVWWARRKGARPTVPLGTTQVQDSKVDTAPIAGLGAILISPRQIKAALDDTQAFVLAAFGKPVPKTDSIKFWTSRPMQRKHGYTIEGVDDDRYVYDHRRPSL
jgi:hypothetical protein